MIAAMNLVNKRVTVEILELQSRKTFLKSFKRKKNLTRKNVFQTLLYEKHEGKPDFILLRQV